MKVLKILAIVFGVILLLTGGGLMFGSYAVGKGDGIVQRQLQSSGLAGPVQGTVTAVQQSQVTVDYTDEQGTEQTGEGQAALTKPATVGDRVSVFYSPDAPEIVVVTDVLGGSLTQLGSGLRTGGIVCLALGAALILGGIIGMVIGKKPARLPQGPPQYGPQQGPPQYGPQQGPPPQGYPPPYPNQGYPQQGPPNQGYPPPNYPPPNYPPPNYPPQPPSSAR